MARAPLTPTPLARDPELDPAAPVRLGTLGDEPQRYQRLVANPFLGFLGVLVLVTAAYHLMQAPRQSSVGDMALVLAPFALLGLPRLFQYHCLDCGTTGRLFRWRSHVCPASADRYLAGRPRRLRGPNPTAQVLLWVYVLLGLVIAWQAGG